MLAAASDGQRLALRSAYVDLATERFGVVAGRVELPAGAVLGSASARG